MKTAIQCNSIIMPFPLLPFRLTQVMDKSITLIFLALHWCKFRQVAVDVLCPVALINYTRRWWRWWRIIITILFITSSIILIRALIIWIFFFSPSSTPTSSMLVYSHRYPKYSRLTLLLYPSLSCS